MSNNTCNRLFFSKNIQDFCPDRGKGGDKVGVAVGGHVLGVKLENYL